MATEKKKKVSADGLILFASLLMTAVLSGLSVAPPQWAGMLFAFLFGAAWIAVLTTLNSTAQAVLPNWVRGRGLAFYMMTVNGAMTAGSVTWGAIGEGIGVPNTLLVGGISLGVMALMAYQLKLPEGETDLTPSNHWPEPIISDPAANDRGPVLVTVEYRVRIKDRTAFMNALARVSEERRRDGAYAWGVTEDTSDQERILEWFFVESWAEHLRQHRRVSKADAALQAELAKFHTGEHPPMVSHFLALDGQQVTLGIDH